MGNSAPRRESTEEQKTPEMHVKKKHRMTEENLFTLPPVPGPDFWEQLELAVAFRPHEQRHGYVVEACIPEFDIKDLKLRLTSDESSLVIEGVRLPSSAQKSKMQRVVASQLGQFAQRSPEQFARLSEEAFRKVGQDYFGRFSRTFCIPDNVAVADIKASYGEDKLKVVLPKRRPALDHIAPDPATYRHRGMANPFQHMGRAWADHGQTMGWAWACLGCKEVEHDAVFALVCKEFLQLLHHCTVPFNTFAALQMFGGIRCVMSELLPRWFPEAQKWLPRACVFDPCPVVTLFWVCY